ncbi:MAG: hypothetical protein IPN08_10690 [Bacteroidales bacterium]|nr:hypothetical protein [Bacteroidales bacterium]
MERLTPPAMFPYIRVPAWDRYKQSYLIDGALFNESGPDGVLADGK